MDVKTGGVAALQPITPAGPPTPSTPLATHLGTCPPFDGCKSQDIFMRAKGLHLLLFYCQQAQDLRDFVQFDMERAGVLDASRDLSVIRLIPALSQKAS